MLRWVIASAVLAGAAPSAAEDWRLIDIVGEAPARAALLIDADSIDRSDSNNPVFKVASVFETPLAIEGAPAGVGHLVLARRIDCAANTVRYLNTDAYDASGAFMFAEPSQMTEAIAPGQPTSVYRRAVCEQEWAPQIRSLGEGPLPAIRVELFGG
jgi:hypothetical protein